MDTLLRLWIPGSQEKDTMLRLWIPGSQEMDALLFSWTPGSQVIDIQMLRLRIPARKVLDTVLSKIIKVLDTKSRNG